MKRVLKAIGYTLLLIILLYILGIIFPPISNIAINKEEINIRTGQVRDATYLFGLKISETITDTFISRSLSHEVNAADIKPWHIVNKVSFINPGPSPHYCFHGAILQIRDLNNLIESNSIDDSKKREIAEKILSIWQTTGSYFKANEYIFQLKKEYKIL